MIQAMAVATTSATATNNPTSTNMSNTILVTGGAGYIGSHMTKILHEAGHQVIILDNLSRGNESATRYGRLVVGDIRDACILDDTFTRYDIDAVMHFAALAYVGESVSEPDLYYQNNVLGSLSLLNAMRRHGIDKIVFSSTCATYGVPQQLPITEETRQQPINPYGYSKLMVEQILSDFAAAYGLRSIALRYFNAAGCAADGSLGEMHEPETHLLPLVLFEAQRILAGGDPAQSELKIFGNDFDTSDGTCIRDYIHVTDLCQAHVLSLHRLMTQNLAEAEQFNLGTNRGVSVLEVIDTCRRVTGVEIPYSIAPRRAGDPPELVSDATKAMHTLGWKPEYPDIETSVRNAWDWFQRNRRSTT